MNTSTKENTPMATPPISDPLAPVDEDNATEDHPFPPAPHIDLGDGYTQPPLPGF